MKLFIQFQIDYDTTHYSTVTNELQAQESYITPAIKSMLRRKNQLMRAGRVEKAGALSARIRHAIQRRCRSQLSTYDGKTDSADMWAAVREITGRQATSVRVDGITAETLNRHYPTLGDECVRLNDDLNTHILRLTGVNGW